MNKKRSILKGVTGAAFALGLIASTSANALVTEGDANAYAVGIDTVLVDVSPIPNVAVSGNNSDSSSVISLSVPPYLSTGILNADASSNVDGSPGPKEATASSSIVDFILSVPGINTLPGIPGIPAFGLSFDVLSSESTVTGDYDNFTNTGNSSIVNLQGSGLLAVLSGVTISGEPNQGIDLGPGIGQVIINRQSSSCDAFDCFMTTDALYISLLGLAEITLGHSHAHLAGVIPEPETTALMMLGLAGLAGSKRFRNKVRAVATT